MRLRALSAALSLSSAIATAFACRRDAGEIAKPTGEGPSKPKDPPSTPPKPTRVPAKHREAHVACEKGDTKAVTYAPKPATPPGKPCTTGADCTEEKNGRCNGGNCTYDKCYEDKDCDPKGVCTCQQQGRSGWFCKPSECTVDADCGVGNYCSPSWDTECGAFFGVVGFYCHTKDDACLDDADCVDGGAGGYCAFDKEKKRWRCGYGHCVG